MLEWEVMSKPTNGINVNLISRSRVDRAGAEGCRGRGARQRQRGHAVAFDGEYVGA